MANEPLAPAPSPSIRKAAVRSHNPPDYRLTVYSMRHAWLECAQSDKRWQCNPNKDKPA